MYNIKGDKMYKKYKKDSLYSYTLGAFPTFELINGGRSKEIEKILISKKYQNSESLIKILEDKKLKYEFNDKNISLLSDKGNVLCPCRRSRDTLCLAMNPANAPWGLWSNR